MRVSGWLSFFWYCFIELNSTVETWAAHSILKLNFEFTHLNSATMNRSTLVWSLESKLVTKNLYIKYLLKKQCCCPRSLEARRVHCFAQTLMPATEEGEKERETIELMSAMRHLSKLYQTSPKIIPSNMSLISALENYFQSPYQNPLLFIYHFLWPWSQQSENYPPQGSNYSSPPSFPAALFC